MSETLEIKRSDLKYGKKIGEGGYSTVYQMTWLSNGNKQVAVKKLHKIERWELDILSKLQHTNIVQLFGVVDEEMDFMLVLEYCEGGSLRSYLDEHSDEPLTSQLFYDWAEQAAKPIKYLKQMNIVHKDIKSLNYLISKGNVLKLADFGLAKKIDATISNATLAATAAWMAPELAKDFKLSPTYDIFAYAVVLWELWTRESPFKGKEAFHIVWLVCSENKRLIIPPDCPTILADLMKQCWETDRQKRPSIDHVLSIISKAKHKALKFEQQMTSVSQDLQDLSMCSEVKQGVFLAAIHKSEASLEVIQGTTKGVHGDIGLQVDASEGQAHRVLRSHIAAAGQKPLGQMEAAIRQPNLNQKEGDLAYHSTAVHVPGEEDQRKAIGSWKFETAIGLDPGPGELLVPCGIDITPNGNIAVAEMSASKLNVYHRDGRHIFSLDIHQNLKPRNAKVAVSQDGKFFITDCTHCVHVYENMGKYLGQLLAISPGNIASDEEVTELVSVAIDSRGRLLVGESIQRYISIHKTDNGEHFGSIQLRIEPLNLAVTSNNTIIISDSTRLLMVDYLGNVLRTLEPELSPAEEWLPRGVACCHNMVAVCNYYSNGIYCFSITGDYLGSISWVDSNDRVSRDISFAENGTKLLVSRVGCVQVYTRK